MKISKFHRLGHTLDDYRWLDGTENNGVANKLICLATQKAV